MYQLFEAQKLQNKKQADKIKKAQAVAKPVDRQPDSVVATSDSFVEEVKAQRDSGPSELSSLDAVIDALNLARTVLKTTKIPEPPIPPAREAPPKKTEAPTPKPVVEGPPVSMSAGPLQSRPNTGYEYLRASSPQGLPLDEDEYPDRLERNPIHKALLNWSRQLMWRGWDYDE